MIDIEGIKVRKNKFPWGIFRIGGGCLLGDRSKKVKVKVKVEVKIKVKVEVKIKIKDEVEIKSWLLHFRKNRLLRSLCEF